MALNLPVTPQQSTPPLDDRGGDAHDEITQNRAAKPLPPLFVRVWWIFFNGIATTLTAVSNKFDALVAALATPLVHPGRVVKVGVSAGTLAESSLTDILGAVQMLRTAGLQYARVGNLVADGFVHITENLSYDGANWNLDDISAAGAVWRIASGGTYYFTATAGANPRTLTEVWHVDGTTGAMYIQGLQVVGPQLAAITVPSGGGTTVTAPSGGATIDSQARTAIGSIITAISSGGNTVDPVARTAIGTIITRLKTGTGHGLTA